MSATNSQQELTLTIICREKDEVSIVFYAVPQLAADQAGEIRIGWWRARRTTRFLPWCGAGLRATSSIRARRA